MMAEELSADEKIALICKDLQEVLKPDIIENVIKTQNVGLSLAIFFGVFFELPLQSLVT